MPLSIPKHVKLARKHEYDIYYVGHYLNLSHKLSYYYRFNLLYNIKMNMPLCYSIVFNNSVNMECYDDDIYPCNIKDPKYVSYNIEKEWMNKPQIYRNNNS